VVLFCARLHPRKGLLPFLAACALLQSEGRPLRIVVAGEDEGARPAAERFAEDRALPVEFTGGLDHEGVDRVMATADVLVHPAPQEPFGMSMLEAFAHQLPVVAAPSSELAPLFRRHDAATLPESESPEAYARAIAAVLDDGELTARRVTHALDLVRREFSVDALERHLRDVVASLTGRAGGF
jgi:glycosyltransferase involved in cell wall biosynthesis